MDRKEEEVGRKSYAMKFLVLVLACVAIAILAKPTSTSSEETAAAGGGFEGTAALAKAPEVPSAESQEEVSPPQGIPAARPRPEIKSRKNGGSKTGETTPLSIFNIA